jgi:transketolase
VRTAFIQQLILEARRNPQIFLAVGDLGYSVVEPFAEEFPERFLNAGVAEQNMTGVAAGLASEGYHVFTYSISNFPTFRCAEQIRNDIVYHGLPVTVVAVGGGLSYGNLGYSHHAVQDIGLMRLFPGMLLGCPGDPAETQACVQYLTTNSQPSYLRLGKAGEPKVHASIPSISPGVVVPLLSRPDARNALLTTGATLKLASEAAGSPALVAPWNVASLPLWGYSTGPQMLVEWMTRYTNIVVVEDHLATGGFGSFVRESLNGNPALSARVHCVALDPKICGMVGSQSVLNARGGLSIDALTCIMNRLDRST